LAFGLAGALSIIALGRHFAGFVEQFTGNAKYVLLGIAIGWQVFLLFVFFMVFF
jgi:hypothetical protein